MALALGGAGQARAELITFEGHRYTSEVSKFQNGFWFTFAAQGWGIWADGDGYNGAAWVRNGTTRLVADGELFGSPAFVDITREGKPFTFRQFDGATFVPGYKGGIQIIGRLYGGGTVTASYSLTDDFTTYPLPSTFSNLTGVRVVNNFSGNYWQEPGFSLDNLLVHDTPNAAPEPASLTLVGIGAAALAGYGWRRRRQVRS
jgi:hypothetical protein